MITANLIYDLKAPGAVDVAYLFLKLDSIVEVLLPRSILADAVLLEILTTEHPNLLILKLGFDDHYTRIFDDFLDDIEMSYIEISMN